MPMKAFPDRHLWDEPEAWKAIAERYDKELRIARDLLEAAEPVVYAAEGWKPLAYKIGDFLTKLDRD